MDDPPHLLFDALRAVGQGDVWCSPRLLPHLLKINSKPQSPPEELTEREREVLYHVAQGCSNKQIARLLVLSHRTVETHISNILGKLGVATRLQATLWLQEQNLSTEQK